MYSPLTLPLYPLTTTADAANGPRNATANPLEPLFYEFLKGRVKSQSSAIYKAVVKHLVPLGFSAVLSTKPALMLDIRAFLQMRSSATGDGGSVGSVVRAGVLTGSTGTGVAAGGGGSSGSGAKSGSGAETKTKEELKRHARERMQTVLSSLGDGDDEDEGEGEDEDEDEDVVNLESVRYLRV